MMNYADRTTEALHAAIKAEYEGTLQAGRDMAREFRQTMAQTDLVMTIGTAASLVLAAEHLAEIATSMVRKLREQLAATMLETGAPSIAIGNGVTVSMARRPSFVSVDEEARIPRHFFTQPAPTLDKKALKEALKTQDIPGCHLAVPNDQVLRISTKRHA